MKILYYSDTYTWENYGTKRSIWLELDSYKDISARFVNKSNLSQVLKMVRSFKADQVWLAHSGLVIDSETKGQLNAWGVPIIGVGMSDPNYFKESRLSSYNAYITNSVKIYDRYKDSLPCFYNKTACDFRFHAHSPSIQRNKPVTMIGLARHPYFPDKNERKRVVNMLRKKGFDVYAYGNGWPDHEKNFGHIEGEQFKVLLQTTQLGLDVQNLEAPLAHRMFEYAGCGTPVITRNRPEVFSCFDENKEIITYSTLDELYEKVAYYLQRPELLQAIGMAAYKRCKKEHNISHRVKAMLPFIKRI